MTNNEPADSILTEIHQTRQALLKQHGGIAGLAAYLREEEKNSTSIVEPPAEGSLETLRPRSSRLQ